MTHQPRVVSLLTVLLMAGCSPATSPAPSQSPLATVAASVPTASTASPATTALPATPTPTTNTAWIPVPEQADVRAVQFQDVLWTGARFVAAAMATVGGGAFLDSADGKTWHLQAYPGSTAWPMRLASGPRGIVALGRDADGRALSWQSNDGLAWATAKPTFGKGSGDDTIEVTDVVATDTGWLAVGREDPYCNMNCGLEPVRALVWSSSDGLTWTRLPDQKAFKGGAMTSVVRTTNAFVAVGSAGLNAAAWTSPDGLVWTRTADAPVFHAALSADGDAATQMASVALGSVLVAVGTEFPIGGDKARTARAWWSADGVTWVEAKGELFEEGQLFQVAATSRGFLAGGPSGPPSCGGGVWASTDGRSWLCASSASEYAGMTPYAAAASPTIEIVVGFDGSIESDAGSPGGVWWRLIQ